MLTDIHRENSPSFKALCHNNCASIFYTKHSIIDTVCCILGGNGLVVPDPYQGFIVGGGKFGARLRVFFFFA